MNKPGKSGEISKEAKEVKMNLSSILLALNIGIINSLASPFWNARCLVPLLREYQHL